MNQELIRVSVLSVGERKGIPRIWLEGKYLEKAGFVKGCSINVNWSNNQLLITLDQSGKRTVCSKKYPVIDINNNDILKIFNISEKVKAMISFGSILITKAKKEIRKLTALKDRSCGSVFSGGGLLDEAAKRCGFKTKWGIELNKDYADIWQQNHPGVMYNSDISDVDFNELEPVELLIGGIPCEPYSRLTSKNNKMTNETADLSMFFLMVVEAVNPRTIVLEEVPSYIKSGVGIATLSALKRMGYDVDYRLICGKDVGELAIRNRLVVIASLDGKPTFPVEETKVRTMSEILLPVDDPSCEWFDRTTKAWVFEHWENSQLKGRNFFPQLITESTPYVQAIPKRYFEQQAGNPLVKHPTKEGVYRWLTIKEVKKLMGLQDDYVLSEHKTISGKVLGQGVIVSLFQKVIQNIVSSLMLHTDTNQYQGGYTK